MTGNLPGQLLGPALGHLWLGPGCECRFLLRLTALTADHEPHTVLPRLWRGNPDVEPFGDALII